MSYPSYPGQIFKKDRIKQLLMRIRNEFIGCGV